METTSILWIQKISFAQFWSAHVGFGGFAQPGFNGFQPWLKPHVGKSCQPCL